VPSSPLSPSLYFFISGDKLGAAKTIGLACNLIDPDMQPAFKDGVSVEEYIGT
jgi:hypothetical protein